MLWNFLANKCVCVFLNILHHMGCTYDEIMWPEQNKCVFYAGHTSKCMTVLTGFFKGKMQCMKQ